MALDINNIIPNTIDVTQDFIDMSKVGMVRYDMSISSKKFVYRTKNFGIEKNNTEFGTFLY